MCHMDRSGVQFRTLAHTHDLRRRGGVLRTRTGIGSRGQLFDAGADGEILLGSGGCEPVFVYRCPVPRQRRAGNGEHVEGELAEVVSAV